MFDISRSSVESSVLDGLSEGKSLGQIAQGIIGGALGFGGSNDVTCYIMDPQLGIELQLPVNPQKITLSWGRKTETVSILNLGDVDFTTGDKLTEVSFDSFFPHEYVPAYCTTATPPTPTSANAVMCAWKSRFASSLKGLKDPIHLVITGAQDININCLLTSYESHENGGEPGDIYYSATFKEWREIYVRKSSESKQNRVNLKPPPKLVKMPTPVSGNPFASQEGLWQIAKRHYGNGESWPNIAQNNAGNIAAGVLRL